MKKIIGFSIALMLTGSSLIAWNYYPRTSYSSNSEGCRQESNQRARTSRQPLEQQYANLIIMFTRDDCPYCRYMMPIMKQVEKKFGKEIKFLYVDVARYPQYPAQYGFSTVPNIAYFKNGKKLDAHGSGDKTMTVEQVEENIINLGMSKTSDDVGVE